jgi:hypothetical protein
MSSLQGRRSFVSILASLVGVSAIDAAGAAAAQTPARPAGNWDLAWLDQLKGSHKQAYDYGSFDISDDTRPLRFVRNYLDTYRDVFGLSHPDINTAVGISRNLAINASDALWARFRLGERYKIVDASTKQPAVRNIFLEDVKALQARGTVFWQCNVALTAIAGQLAPAAGRPADEVRKELIEGLNPGVHLMPSHVMALGMVQERGFTYMKP